MPYETHGLPPSRREFDPNQEKRDEAAEVKAYLERIVGNTTEEWQLVNDLTKEAPVVVTNDFHFKKAAAELGIEVRWNEDLWEARTLPSN